MANILVTYPVGLQFSAGSFLTPLEDMGHHLTYYSIFNEPTQEKIDAGPIDVVLVLSQDLDFFSINQNEVFLQLDVNGSMSNTLSIPVLIQPHPQPLPPPAEGIDFVYLDDPEVVQKIDARVRSFLAEHANSSAIFPGSAGPDQPTPSFTEATPQTTDEDEFSFSVKYWLLKINPHTWNIDSFKVGYQAYFNIYYANNSRRIDDEYFQRLKKGDQIIGYSYFERKAIECVFELTKGAHSLQTGGTGVSMMINRLFRPPLSFDLASEFLPPEAKLEGDSPERLFPITKKTFNEVIRLADDFVVRPRQYIGSYTTEGNHTETEDRLSFMQDIESFGSVICLKTVRPPLAIALFGRWGSGKSFFMQKLAGYVDALTRSDDERYVQHIVQVTFNSWHYSDANLWASIISDIFEELNNYATNEGKEDEIKKLSQSLQLTGLQKEAVEQKKKELEEKVTLLKQDKLAADSQKDYLLSIRGLKQALSEENIKKVLSSVHDEDIDQLVVNEEKITGYIKQVRSLGGKLTVFLSELRNARGKYWILAAVAFSLLMVGVFWFAGRLIPWSNLKTLLLAELAPLAVISNQIVKVAKTSANALSKVMDKLVSIKRQFEGGGVQKAVSVKEVESKLADVKSDLAVLDKKIEEAKKQIDDISSGKKLMDFINARSRDENYARQLGLISLVRKDFETLDKLLREQHQLADEKKTEISDKEGISLRIDRVILYIDDLDRCSEEIVVKVLEAIHLLLAFPLFVVVVGVDPRWLNNALNKKYGTLFYHQQSHEIGAEEGQHAEPITSYDYLEKIFQIPFALKQANSGDRKHLLRYLLRDEIAVEEKPKPATNNQGKAKKSETVNPAIIPAANAPINPGTAPLSEGETVNETKNSPKIPEVDPIKFSRAEIDFMEQLSDLFGHTPRAINRYINIYRIIKSHKSYHVAESRSQTDYMATMFLLALISGDPESAQLLINELQLAKESDMKTFTDALSNAGLKKVIAAHLGDDLLKVLTVAAFKKNLHLIARFSFRMHFTDQL